MPSKVGLKEEKISQWLCLALVWVRILTIKSLQYFSIHLYDKARESITQVWSWVVWNVSLNYYRLCCVFVWKLRSFSYCFYLFGDSWTMFILTCNLVHIFNIKLKQQKTFQFTHSKPFCIWMELFTGTIPDNMKLFSEGFRKITYYLRLFSRRIPEYRFARISPRVWGEPCSLRVNSYL